LLIGTGPIEPNIRQIAAELGIVDRVTFAGARGDVGRLMTGAMDAFVMPSLYEGLSLAAIEAQAAGLPTILSSALPPEVDIGAGLARFISLKKTPAEWAQSVLEHTSRVRISRAEALSHVSRTVFNIDASVSKLQQFYIAAKSSSSDTEALQAALAGVDS
jgi:glycosyltransferase involved in cell wall biosynthesis